MLLFYMIQNIFHGVMSLDQLYMVRPTSALSNYRSPLSRLYLCGSGAHPGSMLFIKLKLPVLICLHSTIQSFSHHMTIINLLRSFGYIMKLGFGSPWQNYFTPGFVCSQHMAPRNIKFAQTLPSHCTNSHLGRVEPQSPEKFMLGQCRIRTTDLLICPT